ncbi:hypothetical protein V493_01390 [Pseudogymnoascus sp. VKM F-4281 (FW-2241)]|nr:hypothetical protein V493_01390 [Pseudogymnoascus sp. VKM F-4281 (FW-2241)]
MFTPPRTQLWRYVSKTLFASLVLSTYISAVGANPVGQHPEQKPEWSVSFPVMYSEPTVNRRPSGCNHVGEIVEPPSFANFNDGWGYWALCLYSDGNCQHLVDDIEGHGDGTTRRAPVGDPAGVLDVQSYKVIDSDQMC